ncbi:MAG: exo-alpha-sialidase [Anaerolineae bacterium]|nr:exo-alpha-sialidase [Gemmatimonadaceae bacterium]
MSATELHATWWQFDNFGKTHLAVARSSDEGASWSAPELADTRDRARARCSYPPPAVAADSATGYVHLAYFLQSREGAGVWYTHSMDRGANWHPATALIFGDATAHSSIAADGWLLAVVYQAPQAPSRQIWLTLSRDAGHSFERPLMVTREALQVAEPGVSLEDRTISVTWTERSQGVLADRIVTREGVVSIDSKPARSSQLGTH